MASVYHVVMMKSQYCIQHKKYQLPLGKNCSKKAIQKTAIALRKMLLECTQKSKYFT